MACYLNPAATAGELYDAMLCPVGHHMDTTRETVIPCGSAKSFEMRIVRL